MSKREASCSDSGQSLRNESTFPVNSRSPISLFQDTAESNAHYFQSSEVSFDGHISGTCDLRSTQLFPSKMEQDSAIPSAWTPSIPSDEHVSMPTDMDLGNGFSIAIDTATNEFMKSPELQAAPESRDQQYYSAAVKTDEQQSQRPTMSDGISTQRNKIRAQPSRTQPDATGSDDDIEMTRKEKNRAKNKIAAAKCRRTKQRHVEAVENKHRDLSAENAILKSQQRQLHATVMQLRTWALAHQDCTCGVHQFNMLKARDMYSTGRLDTSTMKQQDRTLAPSFDSIDSSTLM